MKNQILEIVNRIETEVKRTQAIVEKLETSYETDHNKLIIDHGALIHLTIDQKRMQDKIIKHVQNRHQALVDMGRHRSEKEDMEYIHLSKLLIEKPKYGK